MYKIVYKDTAKKELNQLSLPEYKKVKKAIDSLAKNPFPAGSLKLQGIKGKLYRIRKGNYRVIYSVHNTIITITILKIAHRKDAYRS